MQSKSIASGIGLCLLCLAIYPFADHAVSRGLQMNSPDEVFGARLFHAGDTFSNWAIYGHMVVGGALSLLAPLQLVGRIRREFPAVHRIAGYILFLLAMSTGLGGSYYIIARGTIGGLPMDLGFGLYGALMILASVQTVRRARARDPMHRIWAIRLVILALGSWIYRVHYGLWELVAQGAGTRSDFSGPFDSVQMVAFYAPYLLIYEVLRRRTPPARALTG